MKICYCFGPNWSKYIPVQLFALFSNNLSADKIKVHLITDSISPSIEQEIKKISKDFGREVIHHNVSGFYRSRMNSRVNVDTRFTRFTLYRLAIPEFIREDRLLYLDADTLVCGDIQEFYNLDFGDSLVIGCKDPGISKEHIKSIGGNPDNLYVNAGVLLLNLKEIVNRGLHKSWIKMSNTRHFPAHDQDIIHLTLSPHFKDADPKYNCSLSTSLDVEDIRIMHYAGIKSKTDWVRELPNSHLWDQWQNKYDLTREFGAVQAQIIPKTISYGWFGKGPKPEKIQFCIASWKKVCPDYQIIELNEDNCDVTCNDFVKSAFESKKFAFVADYFRMKSMYDHGGITLDADVELLKPLDPFLHHRMFSGQEVDGKILITATMGSEPGHPIVKMILDYYDAAKFDPKRMVPNTQFITDIFKMFIREKTLGKIILENDVHLYPKEYFCNFDHKRLRTLRSSKSYALHHFQGSWRHS